MCRMMATVGKPPTMEMLESFRGLAETGNSLPGSCGHGDGWGFAAWNGDSLAFFDKTEKSATVDDEYGRAAKAIVEAKPPYSTVIGHLRAASQGNVTPVNAHPFRFGKMAFCHNGGIKRSEEIDTYGLKPAGETDSERFFLSIVGRLESREATTLKEAAEQAIAWVHRHLPYSSISFLVSNGETLLAYRDYREHLMPGETELPKNWEVFADYYTLSYSPSLGAVSSEHLTADAGWTLLKNGELVELSPNGHREVTFLKTNGVPNALEMAAA